MILDSVIDLDKICDNDEKTIAKVYF